MTTSGTAGMANTGGSAAGGSPTTDESCPGCARLSVPLTMAAEQTDFEIYLNGPTDLSAATITVHLMASAGEGGGVQVAVKDGEALDYASVYTAWTNVSDLLTGLQDISVDVATLTGDNFDATQVEILALQINAGDTGPWANPTVVLVDSITVSNGAAGPWEFTDSSDPLTLGSYEPVAGSEVTHVAQ